MALPLTLRQIQIFDAIARLKSHTKAAQELNLTQPAVSQQIKQLEEHLQTRLLNQMGHKIQLTDAGLAVLEHGRAMLRELNNLEIQLDNLKGLKEGTLRIATVTTVNYFAPTLLRIFCERYPGITVFMDVANQQELLAQLAANQVDMAIMGQPPEDAGLDSIPFLENPLVIIAPEGHALAKQKKVPLARLADEVFLMREPGSGTRNAMERVFAERGVTITTGVEVSGAEALKQGVQAGLGLALMSRHAVQMELSLGRVVELNVESFPITRAWYLVNSIGKHLSQPAEAFRGFVLNEAEGLLGAPARKKKKGQKG